MKNLVNAYRDATEFAAIRRLTIIIDAYFKGSCNVAAPKPIHKK